MKKTPKTEELPDECHDNDIPVTPVMISAMTSMERCTLLDRDYSDE